MSQLLCSPGRVPLAKGMKQHPEPISIFHYVFVALEKIRDLRQGSKCAPQVRVLTHKPSASFLRTAGPGVVLETEDWLLLMCQEHRVIVNSVDYPGLSISPLPSSLSPSKLQNIKVLGGGAGGVSPASRKLLTVSLKKTNHSYGAW